MPYNRNGKRREDVCPGLGQAVQGALLLRILSMKTEGGREKKKRYKIRNPPVSGSPALLL